MKSGLLPAGLLSAGESFMDEAFRNIAHVTSNAVGSPRAFLIAALSLVVWAATGPLFGYSDTWQLVINTATSLITFLMVFIIQNSQNRDTKAMQIKLDELLRAVEGARTRLVNLENLSDEEIMQLQHEFERISARELKKATHKLGDTVRDKIEDVIDDKIDEKIQDKTGDKA
jgi:low affinity Fe/Cu permease